MSFAILYSHNRLPFYIYIALRSFYCVFIYPSLSFTPLFIQKKCCTLCFQLWSIILQLINLLRKTTIRPELPLSSLVSSGAEFIEAPCPECTKQHSLPPLLFFLFYYPCSYEPSCLSLTFSIITFIRKWGKVLILFGSHL